MQTASLDERAMMAKSDRAVAESLLQEFQPYLRSQVNRYAALAPANDVDSMRGTAMSAFYEAILKYEADKGHFLPFAGRVIRLRMIDGFRKQQALKEHLLLDAEESGEERTYPILDRKVYQDYQMSRQNEDLRLEIAQLNSDLESWGLSMDALVKQSPKQRSLRMQYNLIINIVIENDAVMQTILLKRYFPMGKIAEYTGFPLKKLERARTYLLASIIIKTGDYDRLKKYIGQDQS